MTSASNELTVQRVVRDQVLYITLNRPQRLNAMNDRMRSELLTALQESAEDPDARAVVIRGAGASFCAGGDVTEMATGSQSSSARLLRGRRLIEALAHHPKPLIAAVQGYAVGAGFSLALACDIIVASPDARFSMVFIKRALIPDMGATYFLARQIGLYRAKELALSGRVLDATEAHQLGIVSSIWPTEQFADDLHRYASTLAAGPTLAMGATRRLMNRTFETDLAGVLELEALAQPLMAVSEDHKASIEAFKRKQEPQFHGR
jgi:2-(1,2-epoxy-1,2-dihydrophenyl)acetyl-CoA isomerase